MLTTRNQPTAWRAALPVVLAALTLLLAGCTPPGPRALLDGERLLQEGRPQDALRRFRTAVEFLPGNAQAWNHLGLAYHATRQPAEAAEAYQQALRLDRDLASAHYNLGCLWLEQGDATRAADALRTFVGLRPQSFEGWRKLGQAQLRIRQWDLAERSFHAALRLTPNDPESLNGLGVSLQQRRRLREAWQCFAAAAAKEPRFAPAWLNLAVAAHQAGAYPQAIHAYQQYAALRPDAARALGVEAVLRQLEPPVAQPALIPPPTNATAASATTVIQTPTATGESARPPVTPPPSPAGGTTAPAQPRAPPRRAAAEPSASSPSSSISNLASRPAPEIVPPPASASIPSPTPPATASPSSNPSPTSVALADSPPLATSSSVVSPSPVPATTRPAAGAVAGRPPAESSTSTSTSAPPLLELVRLPEGPGVTTQVRDEPVPSTSTAATGPGPAVTPVPDGAPATGPLPLIRPVPAQRAAAGQGQEERKGFWERANPVAWFTSDKSESTTRTNPPTANAVTPEGDDAKSEVTRWAWANPTRWFRGEPVQEPPSPTPPPPGATESSRAPSPAEAPAAVSGPTGGRETPARRPATTARPPPSEVKRYSYLRPPTPAPGDRAAARPLLSEALNEHRRGRLESAIALYEQSLRLDPSLAEAHRNLAAAQLARDQVPEALASSERALALEPGSVHARLNFALALERGGFPLDAAAEAEKVVVTHPEDVAAHLLLGNVYAQRLDQPDRARPHYLKVIELEPEHPQSAAIRRWLAGRR